MIDLDTEKLISMSEAAREMARLSGSDRVASPTTIWAWTRRGVNGVKLEFIKVGRKARTSREAIHRFVQAQAEAAAAQHTKEPPSEPQVLDATDEQLQAAGLM